MELCFVCSLALTGAVRKGLSGRDRQVDRNSKCLRGRDRRALHPEAGEYAGPTREERQGAQHPGKYAVSSEIVP